MNFFSQQASAIRAGGIAIVCAALAGCISSTAPVLSDAGAILGERGQMHLFGAITDGTRDHKLASFRWSGSRYVLSGSGIGISDFTAHAFEGRDLIVQARGARAPHPIEYAIARRVADGVYLLAAIDENDADDTTRERFCTKALDASCHISTPEQLTVFAHATAAKELDGGVIAVVIPPKER